MARHILIVDDDAAILASLSAELRSRGFRARTARDSAGAIEIIDEDPPDAVLLDLRLGRESGIDLLDRIIARGPGAPPVLMISGEGTIAEAVDALRRGAVDFIEKPLGGEQVNHRIRRALRQEQLESTCRDLEARIDAASGLIGSSPAFRKAMETVELVAPTDARILITGESGTGKELVARAIHAGSTRRDQPFVALNCSAIPRELVESELFGHQKGAFTGAIETRRGCFEAAGGGTLFLDEIGDMPLAAQPKLLRALEESRIQRVGAGTGVPVDVRVIAATNQDLRKAIAGERFREDLYHRLNVVEIALPPLRDRREDIGPLCAHFLGLYATRYGREALTLTEGARREIERHPFSGNVRELRNLMERLTILCRSGAIGVDELRVIGGIAGDDRSWSPPPLEDGDAPLRQTLRRVERELVRRTLREEGWRMADAARRLGLERSHLYRKLKELGIEREDGGTDDG